MRIAGAALLGSAARGDEDRWSDIDLALRLVPGAVPEAVADDWVARVAETEQVVDHLDICASGALYRVLLLSSTLQVDLSFWLHDQPLAGGAPVEVLFGDVPVAPVATGGAGEESLTAVRMGWLHALHARSALGRGRVWQAWWTLESIRDVVVGMYCRRHGLPPAEGRGVDRLPAELLAGPARSLPASIEPDRLSASFEVLMGLLLDEAELQGVKISVGLAGVVTELAPHRPLG